MFEEVKNTILGKDYELSLAFVSPKKSQEINKKYRNKDKSTNVLSFAFGKKNGEILLCKEVIKKEAKNFKKTYKKFLLFLVIHGMLHLKGNKHGLKMENLEKKFFSYFKRKIK